MQSIVNNGHNCSRQNVFTGGRRLHYYSLNPFTSVLVLSFLPSFVSSVFCSFCHCRLSWSIFSSHWEQLVEQQQQQRWPKQEQQEKSLLSASIVKSESRSCCCCCWGSIELACLPIIGVHLTAGTQTGTLTDWLRECYNQFGQLLHTHTINCSADSGNHPTHSANANGALAEKELLELILWLNKVRATELLLLWRRKKWLKKSAAITEKGKTTIAKLRWQLTIDEIDWLID